MKEKHDFQIRTIRQRRRVTIDCGGGLTKQSHKDECDVNMILKKFQTQGLLPEMIKSDPQYGDFSDVGTFQESLEVIRLAEEQFSALPAAVRKEFDNDPAKFLEFAGDPRNGEKLVKMGLATARPSGEAVGSTEAVERSSEAPKGRKSSPSAPSSKKMSPSVEEGE